MQVLNNLTGISGALEAFCRKMHNDKNRHANLQRVVKAVIDSTEVVAANGAMATCTILLQFTISVEQPILVAEPAPR